MERGDTPFLHCTGSEFRGWSVYLAALTPTRAPGHSLGGRGHFLVQEGPPSQIW